MVEEEGGMGWGYLKWYGVVSTHAVKGEGGGMKLTLLPDDPRSKSAS